MKGIRLRLALRAALFSGLSLAGVAVLLELTVVSPMEAREDDRLRNLADGLASLAAKDGAAGFRGNSDAWVRATRGEWAALLAPDGSLAAAAGGGVPEDAARSASAEPSTLPGAGPDGDRVAAREVAAPDGKKLRVVVGLSLAEVREDQNGLRLLVALAAAACVVLVGVGAWSGAGAVLDPLAAMTDAARNASKEPASLRLPETGRGSEFEELSRLLNDLLGRIAASLDDERKFAGDAAHELRGPLSVLRLRAEKALISAESGEMRAALESSIEDCDRVGRLVDALLEMSRISMAGGAPAPRDRVDAAAALAALAPDFEALAAARGVRFALEAPAAPVPPVAAPREVVETCLSVLVDNACRYTPPGGGVRVGASAGTDGVVRLAVADDGPGVGEEERERVFDRLYRGKAARGVGAKGFGLGLSLARRLARSAGGDVVLENPGERGARFAVLLPRASSP